jgi:hypothetical protein
LVGFSNRGGCAATVKSRWITASDAADLHDPPNGSTLGETYIMPILKHALSQVARTWTDISLSFMAEAAVLASERLSSHQSELSASPSPRSGPGF